MIKEQNKIIRRVELFSDLCLVTVSFFIGYFLRDKIIDIYPISFLEKFLLAERLRSLSYYAIYIGLLPVLLVIWATLLSYFGMYKSPGVKRIPDVLLIIFKTAVVGFILFGSYVFILRMQENISRLFIGFTFLTASILITLEKIALLHAFKALSKKDTSFRSSLIVFRRILIVGTGKRALTFINKIDKNPEWGIKILGLIDINPSKRNEIIKGYKVLGTIDDLPTIIHKNIIDEIVFILPRSLLSKIEKAIHYCESAGLKIFIAVDLFDLKISKTKQTDLDGIPLLAFESTAEKLDHIFIKRLFDFVTSGLALLLLMPVFVIIAILIKISSGGPIFFKQLRCGLYGRKFVFYKFRTMIADAESKLKDLAKYNEMNGPVFKMTNDPRITRVGKWLRKFSIDELPQLWNVFKGDMSLVGPRPPLPSEVEQYDIWQRRRLSMRPGITCLWQARGRNKITDFTEWMRLDLEYIDTWSLLLDFKILIKTIPVVLFGTGAK
jgi:exopolysaccharide biosynthesis polyprenyl glycosylphosphotransferase